MFYLLVLIAAASRFMPHPPNVTCIAAMGLIAGCYVPRWRSYAIPVAALLISDIVGSLLSIRGMGFYSPMTMAFVYGGVLASVPIGRWMVRGTRGWSRVAAVPVASIAASTAFFLISNAGVALSGWYALSISGVIACYVAAIPFYGMTLVGDLAFSAIMFGAMAVSGARVGSLERKPVAVAA